MSTGTLNRRDAIRLLTGGAMTALITEGASVMVQGQTTSEPRPSSSGEAVARAGGHSVKPLPFNPRTLRGLSERLITSHHENNYGGAVKNLNMVEAELERVTKDTPGFMVGGLRERELTFRNSVILHELYFGNLGGDGRPAGGAEKAISEAFGSFSRWEALFRATGLSLAGGSGWAVLDYCFHSGDVRISWSGSHTQALAFGSPLLVMDMYEHAYHIDYGAAAARYIDAFLQNLNWDVVNIRLDRARKAAALLIS